jgi:sugar lactone lactonase YvrE
VGHPRGQITVFDLPDNIFDVAGITRGSDGNLWLSGDGYILRVTPQGQAKEFALSTLSGTSASQLGASALAAGPDSAIWFLSNQHWVGRMTTDGVLKHYPYPRKVDFPVLGQHALLTSIFGSNGTLWITNGSQFGHFV